MRRAKIVCTLGPAVDSREAVRALIQAGMNVARINCSYGDWNTRLRWIEWVREFSPKLAPVGILVDLQGRKVRIGALPSDVLTIERGRRILFGPSSDADIPFTDANALQRLAVGDVVLLGDGAVELRLINERDGGFESVARAGGVVRSRQGVSVIGKSIAGRGMTDRDREVAVEAARAGADVVALSYVQGASELDELRGVIERSQSPAQICAKIETEEALRAIDEIIEHADMLMIARGDLGLQVRLERIPILQKRLIRKCARVGKPIITATQMLESMAQSARPTRAEVTDVANAILDGTDAMMLSAETSVGAYPIAAVKMMARIAREAEQAGDPAIRREAPRSPRPELGVTRAVAAAAVAISEQIAASAILVTTTSGQTARWIAQARPKVAVYAVAWSEEVARQLSVTWGVQAIALPRPVTTDEAVQNAMLAFRELGMLRPGQRVVVTAGAPPGTTDRTNLATVQTVP